MTGGATAQNASDLLTQSLVDELASLSFSRHSSLNLACTQLLSTRGKMLRGQLVFAAARQGPLPYEPSICRLAHAIELLHLASLAHDDIIDSGAQRRGAPTASAQFGRRTAGFAGAWIFSRAVEIVAESAPQTLDLFAETALEVCEGGMRELRGFYDTSRSVDDYFAVATQKTASVFSLAARSGGELAGASSETIFAIAEFAYEFGIAWQIWDDLTDLLAGSELSGKTALSDLQHGVFTLPVIYAMEENDQLHELLATARVTGEDHASAVSAVRTTGGVARAAEVARDHASRAAASVEALPDPESLLYLLETAMPRHLDELQ